MEASLKCGIVGTNFISDWCVEAMHKVDGIEPVAVVSRTQATGEEFLGKHDIPVYGEGASSVWFPSVEELLEARSAGQLELDALYIASPNALHRDQAIAALNAGLHVLCEKVLGVGSSECAEVLEAARASGTVLLEEVRPLHDPRWALIREAIPRIGTVRRLAFEKCQYSSRYDDYKRGIVHNAFNPSLGNSALADIGVYAVQPALWLLGTPTRTEVVSTRLENEFDSSGTVVLDFGTARAECSYSKVSSTVRPSVIEGEDGVILIDSVAEPCHVELRLRSGETQVLCDETFEGPWQNFLSVLESFVSMCRGETSPNPYQQVSYEFAKVLD